MNFIHGLSIGQRLSTYQIQEIFKHNRYRGMRRSLTTNTLVLISNHYDSPYEDRWIDGILHYNGMGLKDDQKLIYENKTLAESNENGVEVFLFEIFDESYDKYIFMGKMKLCGSPYQEKQYDTDGKLRNVWVFPLMPMDFNPEAPLLSLDTVKQASNSKLKQKNISKLSHDELEKRAKLYHVKVGTRQTTVKYFIRNNFVSAYTKRRANGFCDLCENKAPFNTPEGDPYLETHHIKWLSRGGKDSVENTVALCPNCHRKMHIVNNLADIEKLKKKY